MLRKGARGAEGEFDQEEKRGRRVGGREVKRMNGRSWDEKVEERIVERGEKYEGRFKCGEERKVWVDKGTFLGGKM